MSGNSDLINVRIPAQIAEWLDSLVKKGIYKSRSEAIRDFIRLSIRRETCNE